MEKGVVLKKLFKSGRLFYDDLIVEIKAWKKKEVDDE